MIRKLVEEVVRVGGGVLCGVILAILAGLIGWVVVDVLQLAAYYIHVCDCETIPRKLHLH